jgi:hypothetical protein
LDAEITSALKAFHPKMSLLTVKTMRIGVKKLFLIMGWLLNGCSYVTYKLQQ